MTEPSRPRFIGSAAGWFFCAFALIAAFFLIAEHKAHLGFLLPYVPLAFFGLCIVLHSYMHGLGHDHGSNSGSRDNRDTNRSE